MGSSLPALAGDRGPAAFRGDLALRVRPERRGPPVRSAPRERLARPGPRGNGASRAPLGLLVLKASKVLLAPRGSPDLKGLLVPVPRAFLPSMDGTVPLLLRPVTTPRRW